MIRKFRHRGLKRLFENGDTSKVPADYLERVENILFLLDTASNPRALEIPSYRLHRLKGDMKGFWSVMVSGNWRIIFKFEDGEAYDVDLIDYH